MSLHPSVPRGLCVALYKGTDKGWFGWQNRLGRYLDRGPYSHAEIIMPGGMSYSSSWMDGGVRGKRIGYSSVGNWDFLPLPEPADDIAVSVGMWFSVHAGLPYDLMGNLRFATGFARDSANKWFCSEAVMASLGYAEAFRYGPSGMAVTLQRDFNTSIIHIGAE